MKKTICVIAAIVIVAAVAFASYKQGEKNVKWDWIRSPDAFKESTPTGDADSFFICSFGVKWNINQHVTVNGSLSGIFSPSNRNKDSNMFGGQAVVAVGFRY